MTPIILISIIIIGAIILFATEIVSIDLVALLIISSLVLTGILSPEEGIAGFSNKATITVAFMFVLSSALIKTGALSILSDRLTKIFRQNFNLGLIAMMLLIALFSAFINNTPVVAIFIPVAIQIGRVTGQSASKILIPVSFASIFGGTCTLIGTSTNIIVAGIAEKEGLAPIKMFDMTVLGLIFLVIGVVYTVFLGIKFLPNRNAEKDLKSKFKMSNYLTEIQLLGGAISIGKKIMDSAIVKELKMDIIEVRRNGETFILPPGDFVLNENDILKVQVDVEKVKTLKERVKNHDNTFLIIGDHDLNSKDAILVEMIITSNSIIEGKSMREVDFRRRFRAAPLAIRQREEVTYSELYDVKLKAGDVILAEVKSHYVKELKKMEKEPDSPIILLAEETIVDFNLNRFLVVVAVFIAIIILATFEYVDIMIGAISGVAFLVLTNNFTMKETYKAINWKVVFLLAGALSLGTGMKNTGLDKLIADNLINNLGQWGGAVAIVSGLYLLTSILTELMSNNATAALLTPIAIVTANSLGVNPMPFLMSITFAASASFMTPIGYQTNTMVYSAGQYKFLDFIKIGTALNILFWIIASITIPLIFPF